MACICTHLISDASAVSLVPRPEDRTRLLSSSQIVLRPAQLSVAFLYRNAGQELGTGGYISLARLPQQLLKQPALLSLMSWAAVLSLCCFWSAVSTVQSVSVFSNFSHATIVIQQIRYDVRIHMHIHTYIHTYIQTPLAFNTLMWGSLRLAPIKGHIAVP